MNRYELKKILHDRRISPDAYSLDGGHPSEMYVLSHGPRGWSAYYSEHGLESKVKYFDKESDACEYFLQLINSDPSTRIDYPRQKPEDLKEATDKILKEQKMREEKNRKGPFYL